MAGLYGGVTGETETSAPVEPGSRGARRRRMEIHQFKFIAAEAAVPPPGKRRKLDVFATAALPQRGCENAEENCVMNEGQLVDGGVSERKTTDQIEPKTVRECPKFGMTSVRGRRRDMEDAVALHPSFCGRNSLSPSSLHFFGVYDGHGCSHVAMKCKDRLHEILRDELESRKEATWKEMMERSFSRMDKEVTDRCGEVGDPSANCRCELQTPQCDAVGSTAVVAVMTPAKIIVSNCGDSRAVLCRNGVAIPLSSDHKPDRPDELSRIENAGGRVIYWEGPRVLGMLAMSRAIGDSYLKPFVISEPEVIVTDRTAEDECLILASDGLWDVVSNETACGVARMCLRSQKPPLPGTEVHVDDGTDSSDKACLDASILLTKLALARHSSDNVSVIVVDLRRDL